MEARSGGLSETRSTKQSLAVKHGNSDRRTGQGRAGRRGRKPRCNPNDALTSTVDTYQFKTSENTGAVLPQQE